MHAFASRWFVSVSWAFLLSTELSVCRHFMPTVHALSSSIGCYQHFQKSETIEILIATNVISRGMDITWVNVVVNYDMPESSDTYIHRVSTALLTFVSYKHCLLNTMVPSFLENEQKVLCTLEFVTFIFLGRFSPTSIKSRIS